MRNPMRKVSVRLPKEQVERLDQRADGNSEYLSELLRRYIDAGDNRDTRAEQKAAS